MMKAYLACALAVGIAGAGCGDSSTDASGGGGSNTSTNTSTSTKGSGTMSSSMTTASMGNTTSTGSGQPTCPTMDGYTNISGACDLLAQNCDGNNTCGVFDNGMGGSTTDCAITAGLMTTGSPCNPDMGQASECVKGDFCVNGICTRVCCKDNNEPCGSGKCNLKLNFTGTTDFMWVCTYATACTLFTANACAGGDQCHPEEEGLATCQENSGANAPEGGACMYVNDCGDMQLCVGPDAQNSFCRYACTMGSSAAPGLGGCPGGQSCNGLMDFTSIGVCIPD